MTTLVPILILASVLVVPTEGESTLPEVNVEGSQQYIPLEKIAPVGPQSEQELIWGSLTPLECGIERVVPSESLVGNYFMENGLEVFVYDTNVDGKFDVQIALPQGDINRYPLSYMFDRDYDGDPDIKWTDDLRDGTCGDNLKAEWIGDGVTGEKGKEA